MQIGMIRPNEKSSTTGTIPDWLNEPSENRASESVTVRIDINLLARLDRVVQYAEAQGHERITRSYLVRDAVSTYVEAAENAAPGITAMALTAP